jgi:PadR family transcriptional regulator PadR
LSSFNRQLNEIVYDILILRLLRDKDMYGSEMIRAADEKSEGYFKIKEASLYNILHKLEDNGLIEAYWNRDLEDKSLPRRYYRITEKGEDILKVKLMELKLFLKGIENILTMKSGSI